jgi:hypothetical protein
MSTRTVTPVVGSFDPRVCSRCRRNRITCRCRYIVPTIPEQGLYSRKLYEADLELLEQREQAISKVVAECSSEAGSVTVQSDTRFRLHTNLGQWALEQQRECEWMRRLCKAALFRTMMILASRKQESPKLEKAHKAGLYGITDRHGVRLSTAQQEHIRRFATDANYRSKCMAETMAKTNRKEANVR